MQAEHYKMQENQVGVVTTTEIMQLLTRLKDYPESGVCIRFRSLGEMWYPNFLRVLMLTAKGVVILNDEMERKAVTIQRIGDIMQIEIDQPFQNYRPHFHYTVRPG